MLITAGWVLPVSRRPIRNGAVLVERNTIIEVGQAEELLGLPGTDERHDYPDCVMLPGLVNAHTHLSLSAIEVLLQPDAFDRWLPDLARCMAAWGPDDFAASAGLGASRCIRSGVTVVGDIAYGPESLAAAADAGLGGVFYWEVLGIKAKSLRKYLKEIDFPTGSGDCGVRVRCGLSPHSPYTSGPDLIKRIHEEGREIGAPVAIHVAESAAESELLLKGTGPLAETAARMIADFTPPGVSGIAYLDRLGALDGITAVHLGHSLPTDIPRLASSVRGVVTCPLSNRNLSARLARIDRMLKSGIPVGIGTDSAASNEHMDLFAEARLLRSAFPQFPARKIIEMMTSMGAIALGLEEKFGILERGMHADLTLVRTGESDSPEDDLMRLGGPETVEAVLSAGEWRLRDGELCRRPTAKEGKAVEAAAKRASEALAAR